MTTTTPLDPALSVSRFVEALTSGMPRWKSEHSAAVSRVRLLESDRNRWIRERQRSSSETGEA